MKNTLLQLTGYLGEDAKIINKEGKGYVFLSIATNESYPVKDGESTKWIDKTEWHEIFAFSPKASLLANDLKKGDKVEILASISYKTFKDEKGFNRKQVFIKAHFIEKVLYEKQDVDFTKAVVDELVESMTV